MALNLILTLTLILKLISCFMLFEHHPMIFKLAPCASTDYTAFNDGGMTVAGVKVD